MKETHYKCARGPWIGIFDGETFYHYVDDIQAHQKKFNDAMGVNVQCVYISERLALAAPFLLAALKNLSDEFDRYDAAMTAIGRGHEDFGFHRVNARAAIAQAEGDVKK